MITACNDFYENDQTCEEDEKKAGLRALSQVQFHASLVSVHSLIDTSADGNSVSPVKCGSGHDGFPEVSYTKHLHDSCLSRSQRKRVSFVVAE